MVLVGNWIEQVIELVEAVCGVSQVERAERRGKTPAEKAVKVITVAPAAVLGKNAQPEVRSKIVVRGQYMLPSTASFRIGRKPQFLKAVFQRKLLSVK